MHTNPEVLALLALGEHVVDPADSAHLADCPRCRADLNALTRLIEQGRAAPDGETLDEPSDAVWVAIQAELGFIPVTRSWPSAHDPAGRGGAPDPAAAKAANGSSAAGAEAGGQIPSPPSSTVSPAGPAPAATPDPAQPADPSPSRPTAPNDAPASRPGRRALSLVLAAALALIVGIGIGLAADRLRQPKETVIASATLRPLPDWPGAAGTATVEQDAAGNRMLLVDLHTPQPVGGDEQVWLIDPTIKTMRSMGFLRADGKGSWPIPPGTDLSKFPIVDVSDEPAGDTIVAHSGNSIVRGELQS